MSERNNDRQLREALADLVEVIKDQKVSVLHGMTRRETEFLMAALHKANAALLATGDTA